MRILGIDPGTNLMGYGAIACKGNKIELIALDTIKIDATLQPIDKLLQIYREVSAIITRLQVDEMAVEAPFFGKNAQSMLKLGRAQGVIISAGLNFGLEVKEYSPKKIKKSVTGNGNASKEQVAAMLPHILGATFETKYLDATDGLACAVCHHLQSNHTGQGKRYGSWNSFVNQNQSRIKG